MITGDSLQHLQRSLREYIYKKNKSSSVGESHQVQNWDMQYIASIQISKVFVRHIEIAKFAQYPKYLEPRKARDKGLEKD